MDEGTCGCNQFKHHLQVIKYMDPNGDGDIELKEMDLAVKCVLSYLSHYLLEGLPKLMHFHPCILVVTRCACSIVSEQWQS